MNKIKDRIVKTEKVEWRNIKDLQPQELKNDYNSDKTKESIIKNGFSVPFFVWQDGQDIYCIDGHLRIDLLNELIADNYNVPDELTCAFIDAKDRQEAIKIHLNVFNIKTNPINKESLDDWLELEQLKLDEDLDIEKDHLDSESSEDGGGGEDETKGDDNTITLVVSHTDPNELKLLKDDLELQGFECRIK